LARSCALALKRNYKPVMIICADLLIVNTTICRVIVIVCYSVMLIDKMEYSFYSTLRIINYKVFADYRPSYREKEAKDGWKRLLAWFKQNGAK
jgi:dienelactone hydrolase